ncbi:MAG TPA: hypothetical protein VFR67_27090 [Pilimelia sp.]|nr:hypothetical protein [Pilimelia sp.]
MSSGRRADLVVAGVEAVLVAAAVAVGAVLNGRGVPLHADAAPLYAVWRPHVGWGTPLAVAVAATVVLIGPGWARRARWRPLLAAGYLTAVAWTFSLALVDGWSAGLARRLTPQGEYLQEVGRVTNIPTMLVTFTGGILDFQPTSWATHVAGHPPGALLVFIWLDRVGLGGGGPAAVACVLAGATVAVSVPVALRLLGDEPAARTVLPYLVLFPGAVWVGASADGLFAGVVAAGLALLAARGWWAGLAGGLALGFALYLSYGFVLVGVLALVVIVLRRSHRIRVLGTAAIGVAAVVAGFTAAGFWWLDGYDLVVRRYYQGWAADRPYAYWVWANLACLVLAAGPVLAPALRRAVVAARLPAGGIPRATVALPLAAAVAVLAADLSGLSKAEVERIWLPFAVWLLAAVTWLPEAARRPWLVAQAMTAIAINHLLWTAW